MKAKAKAYLKANRRASEERYDVSPWFIRKMVYSNAYVPGPMAQ